MTCTPGAFSAETPADVRRGLTRRLLRSTTLPQRDVPTIVDAVMTLIKPILEGKDAVIRKLQGEAGHSNQHDCCITNK